MCLLALYSNEKGMNSVLLSRCKNEIISMEYIVNMVDLNTAATEIQGLICN